MIKKTCRGALKLGGKVELTLVGKESKAATSKSVRNIKLL